MPIELQITESDWPNTDNLGEKLAEIARTAD